MAIERNTYTDILFDALMAAGCTIYGACAAMGNIYAESGANPRNLENLCEKQFDEMMGKWGLDPEKDLDKIYRIPGGGFIQKKDHKHFHEVLDRHNAEMEAAKTADEDGTGFLYQMFLYELDNHEYGYTGDLEDTLDCLGLTWEELKASPVMLKALNKASTEIREREGC